MKARQHTCSAALLAPRARRRLATVLLGIGERTTNFDGDGRNFRKGAPCLVSLVAYFSSVASRRRARGAREPKTE